MAILITGGAGYIGSHMVYELADGGELPVVIDDFSSGFKWAIPSGVSVFVEDIGDQRRVAQLIAKFGISEIIHLAASVVVPADRRQRRGKSARPSRARTKEAAD
ncbi:UDP-glucose 4-epimerase [Bradyrhizobium algeriense]|uniref:UDP-glucose 4-epimerase n=1 Tax=Bradyrhizobium algeriense TaxID=634784 RepID=A0ABU8BB01_9BRAD